MKCDKCNQEILEPVWVGPGDRVECDGIIKLMVTVVGPHPWEHDEIVVKVESEGFTSLPHSGMYYKGRPVAGFRDPRDERIKELEKAVNTTSRLNDNLADESVGLVRRITLLERQLKDANPLAGLTDEQLKPIMRQFMDWAGYNYHTPFETACLRLLRDIRDNKLEVPK